MATNLRTTPDQRPPRCGGSMYHPFRRPCFVFLCQPLPLPSCGGGPTRGAHPGFWCSSRDAWMPPSWYILFSYDAILRFNFSCHFLLGPLSRGGLWIFSFLSVLRCCIPYVYTAVFQAMSAATHNSLFLSRVFDPSYFQAGFMPWYFEQKSILTVNVQADLLNGLWRRKCQERC